MDTLLLSRSNIEQVINMKDVVEIVDKTYQGFGEGTVKNPKKLLLDLGESEPWPPYGAQLTCMPAYVGWLDSAGMKWIGGFHYNVKKGLPYTNAALTLLINPRSGEWLAVMDGAYISNMRTGAQAAVALKYLLNRKSIRLGLYGAGVIGHHITMAVPELFNIEELKVYDIKREASEKLDQAMRDRVTGNIIIADSPEEAADGDAVVSATPAKDKFIKNSWIKPGAVVVLLGAFLECEDDLILSADKIIVDHVEQALHRGALKELHEKGKITEKDIYATVGEVAAGKKKGRTSGSERVLASVIGTGALDVAVATVAYRRALERGIGSKFAFA